MVSHVLNTVANTYSISIEDIVGRSNLRPKPEARRMVIFCLSHYYKNDTKKIVSIVSEIKRDRSLYYRSMDKMEFEISMYSSVNKKFVKIIESMIEYLENVINELECWLKNNECFDAKIRAEKLIRLEENKETLEYINNLKIN